MTHTVVRQVRQADHSRTAYATYNDDLTNLTHQVMTFDAGQLATFSILEQVDGELK